MDRVTGYADGIKSIKEVMGAKNGVSSSQHTLIKLSEWGVIFEMAFKKLFPVESTIKTGRKKKGCSINLFVHSYINITLFKLPKSVICFIAAPHIR